MTQRPMPLVLRAWMLVTRALAYPIKRVSRHLHTRMGAAPDRFAERLGQPSQHSTGAVIWFHAASLGEVGQIAPLVDSLSTSSQATILVTTTTAAGADWVARHLPGALHQFVPLDTPAAVAGFLEAWQISVAVFVEGDLWPRLVTQTRQRGIPQVLLNARHSRTRERFSATFSALLAGFSAVTCRSEQVADGIRALGVPGDHVHVLPDLRVATARLPCPADLRDAMAAQIGARPVWLAASTHPADEAAVLAAHGAVLAECGEALLILAPRHPKRGAPLEMMARQQGFSVARRSTGTPLGAQTGVYIADTLGELGVFFSLAPVAFLGGSFGQEGGHNPYEPAAFGTAILSGAQVRNFADAYAALAEAGAGELVTDPACLGPRLAGLVGSDEARAMGAAGQAFMQASDGTVSRTVGLIRDIAQARGPTS